MLSKIGLIKIHQQKIFEIIKKVKLNIPMLEKDLLN